MKQMASEKAAYWSLNANCGITLFQAITELIDTDGDGYEYYIPTPFKPGEYSHFLTKFSGKQVWLLRLGEHTNTKIMQAECDGTITLHDPVDEDDAKLQNMWLQRVGVPWRVKHSDYHGWHLADSDGVRVKEFEQSGTSHLPIIKVYAVHGQPTDATEAALAFYNCYECGMTLHEVDHQPAYYKAGLWAHYDTGDGFVAPCHHYCCQDHWTLADTEGPIL